MESRDGEKGKMRGMKCIHTVKIDTESEKMRDLGVAARGAVCSHRIVIDIRF